MSKLNAMVVHCVVAFIFNTVLHVFIYIYIVLLYIVIASGEAVRSGKDGFHFFLQTPLVLFLAGSLIYTLAK